jgi:hypothetical protein
MMIVQEEVLAVTKFYDIMKWLIPQISKYVGWVEERNPTFKY